MQETKLGTEKTKVKGTKHVSRIYVSLPFPVYMNLLK